jgi:hypothetical protein
MTFLMLCFSLQEGTKVQEASQVLALLLILPGVVTLHTQERLGLSKVPFVVVSSIIP